MYQRSGTTSQLKISGSKNSSKELFESREMRYFENFVERSKQIYSKKYKLEPMNVYEKMFDSLNGRIKTEIESSGHLPENNAQRRAMFKVNNYGILYRKNSLELLKLLKKTSVKKLRDSTQEHSLLKKVKVLDLEKNARQDAESNDIDKLFPKLYDFDENLKFEIKQRKNLKVINNQVQLVRHRLAANLPKNIQLQTIQFPHKNSSRLEFKRSAFLASLNYCFENPII